MKHLLLLIVLFPMFSNAQMCDTTYISLDENMEMSVTIEYQNCHYLYVDTVFRAIVDGREVYHDGFCRTYLDPLNNRVRLKMWTESDTSFIQSFYSSGKMNGITKSVKAKSPDYHHYTMTRRYYENGQLESVSGMETGKIVERKVYYENGTLKLAGNDFQLMPYGTITSYHLNGTKAAVFNYQLPDTTILSYQAPVILTKEFYDESGNLIDSTTLDADTPYFFPEERMYIYPEKRPWNNGDFLISEGLYTKDQFSDQAAYSNDMMALKAQILRGLNVKSKCNCTKGIAWISLFVSQEGKITLDKVEFENPSIRKSIEKSIRKIGKWSPGMLESKPVGAYIYTYLVLDF